jgi:hypothetical protein
MGIRFLCPNGHKLNVKAELAGKRAVCPECGAKLMIPAASASPSAAPPIAVVVDAPPQGVAAWHLRSATGEQLGPLSELQFRASIAAGRVTAETLVWREGWREWKPARSVAELLPTPLVATPIAAAAVAAPAEPVAVVAEVPSAVEEVVADEWVVDPTAIETDADKSPALAASTYVYQRQRSKRKQLTLAIAMLLAVVVLAGVLFWVVSLNSAAPTESTPDSSAPSSPSPTAGD